ncbi:unnamed protein product [Caenorhabditis angaria]|uniref:Uncharacterized protein n=1 Tax=Caenorhabditis angaria TaxID=860376 RepID=A0A9P1IYA8_9PELO|nr:unnamed protein product [Caenorhabditis angaria]
MDLLTILALIFLTTFCAFCTFRLLLKLVCVRKVSPTSQQQEQQLDSGHRVFVSNTQHTYSRIYVDESQNVRSVTITRIAPNSSVTPIVG